MSRLSLILLLAGVLPGAAAAQTDVQACPEGTFRIATNNLYEPFHCERQLTTDSPYIPMTPNYKLEPCPRGKHPVKTPGLGPSHRYRCVADKRGLAEPSVSPVLSGASAPAQAARAPLPGAYAAPSAYTRITETGAFQVEIPAGWHVTDGWDEETPGYYVEFDTARQGKQVQLVLSKIERSQQDYVSVDTAIARDKDLQNAVENKPGRAAGFPARFTSVKNSSLTAYIPISDEDYFVLSYSAPDDLYAVFKPVFERMLATLLIAKNQRR